MVLSRRSFVESEFRHWIVFAVARPERRSSLHGAGSDQRVAQFNRVALAVTSQVFSGATAYGGVCGNAEQSVEQSVECGMFRRASASPKFGSADGGVEDQCVGLTEFEPVGHDGLVPASPYLDQDVRIGKDGHRSPRRSSLEPRRSSLTSSLLFAALARDFRIPTKLCIAAMRASCRPRYRSRAACRTNAEMVVFSLRARAWSAPQSWSSRNSCVRLTMYIIHRSSAAHFPVGSRLVVPFPAVHPFSLSWDDPTKTVRLVDASAFYRYRSTQAFWIPDR
jgi:hypothetical protein